MVRWLAHLAVKHYADATLVDRRTALSQLILWCAERGIEQPRDVTKPILERYQRHLFYRRKADGAPLSASTQAQRLIPIRGFFRWLAKENFILSNPASELELPRRARRLPAAVLRAEEVEQVLAVPDVADPIGLRDRAIMELLYATAIRRTELTRLGVWDVDWARSTLMIQLGKGSKDRVVPLGERAKAWLEAYRDQVPPQLVAGRDHGVLSRDGRALMPTRLSERGAGLRRGGRDRQARLLPPAAPHRRDPDAGGRRRHPLHPGPVRLRKPGDDRDLHPGQHRQADRDPCRHPIPAPA